MAYTNTPPIYNEPPTISTASDQKPYVGKPKPMPPTQQPQPQRAGYSGGASAGWTYDPANYRRPRPIMQPGGGQMPIGVKPLPDPRVRLGLYGGYPVGRDGRVEDPGWYGPVMPYKPRGGGPRGIFRDARINPDGSVSGRNGNNEFDPWVGGGYDQRGGPERGWVEDPGWYGPQGPGSGPIMRQSDGGFWTSGNPGDPRMVNYGPGKEMGLGGQEVGGGQVFGGGPSGRGPNEAPINTYGSPVQRNPGGMQQPGQGQGPQQGQVGGGRAPLRPGMQYRPRGGQRPMGGGGGMQGMPQDGGAMQYAIPDQGQQMTPEEHAYWSGANQVPQYQGQGGWQGNVRNGSGYYGAF